MKNKILAITLIGFLGLFMAPTLLAKSQGEAHRAYPEFKPLHATDVEIVKKTSLPGKGRPVNKPGKPPKDEEPTSIATGELGVSVGGTKYAIVIGIANYPGVSSDLRYTDEDAYAMRDVLTEKYGFSTGNIRLLVDEGDGPTDTQPTNATAQSIFGAISEVGSLVEPGDEVVFFFSGHGGKGRASDGDREKIDEAIFSHNGTQLVPIWDGQLKQWFEGYATDRIIFFFDSCISGGMTDLAAPGRIVNMATQETRFDSAIESVFDGVGAGEFTYHFVIKGMGEGLADTNVYDDQTTIEEAFDYAKANVGYDHPTINDNFENDLLL